MPGRGREVLSVLCIFDASRLCILIITLISYSNSPLTLFWDLWRHSVCLTLLESSQHSANDLLLLIYMAPSTSFVAAGAEIMVLPGLLHPPLKQRLLWLTGAWRARWTDLYNLMTSAINYLLSF